MLLDYPTDVRTRKADAADLLRMDDDGGWRPEAAWRPTAPPASVGGAEWGVPSGMIPGEREPGPQPGQEGALVGQREPVVRMSGPLGGWLHRVRLGPGAERGRSRTE